MSDKVEVIPMLLWCPGMSGAPPFVCTVGVQFLPGFKNAERV